LAFPSLRLVFDQLFHVLGVGVVIFGGIEFCCHALDQLQGKIDFGGDQLLVDRQAELVSRADFGGEAECIQGQGIALGFQYAEAFAVAQHELRDADFPGLASASRSKA
jgi:hypothetical protein